MSLIVNKILRTNVPKEAAASGAVLSKRRAVERKLADEDLERRARSMLDREGREARDAAHVRPSVEADGNRGKVLRKLATQGVVQLFNAVYQHQQAKERSDRAAVRARSDNLARANVNASSASSVKDRLPEEVAAPVKALSKASFLELLKMGPSRASKLSLAS